MFWSTRLNAARTFWPIAIPTWMRSGNGLTVNYVETYTRTRSTAANNTILPSFFAETITGADTTSVSACARAAWGPAGRWF